MREPRALTTEIRWLGALITIAGLLLVFGCLANQVSKGGTAAFDRGVLLLFRSRADPGYLVGPAWVPEALRDLTSLGSVTVLSIIVLTVLGYLAITRNTFTFVSVLGAVLGGQVISSGLKILFDRSRPDLIVGAPHVFTSSFPSGHAMLSTVTYLTLGAMLARLDNRKGVKVYFLIVAIILTLLVGISRVALGVHWPTDVLAGWCIGSAWAILCTRVAALFNMRRSLSDIERTEAQ
jgi:undecaprenyl-diphosphatase